MTADLAAQLEQLQRETTWAGIINDHLAEALERRVTALEEIAAARRPRRMLVAFRLGRALRRSVRHFPGDTFAERRAEATTNEWLVRMDQLDARSAGGAR